MNARTGNLAGKPPLGLKDAPAEDRPDYLAAVRNLPCCICAAWGLPQYGRSHAHHAICGRYGQTKSPDVMAIPLCWDHHQGPSGIHTQRAAWVAKHGPDTDWIAGTQDRLAHLLRPAP